MHSNSTWTISQAKARLSEILRLSDEQGPQVIGRQRRYRIVSEAQWQQLQQQAGQQTRAPMGQWLLAHWPRSDVALELADRADGPRAIPFDDADDAAPDHNAPDPRV